MKKQAYIIACLVLATSVTQAKDWTFTGSVLRKSEWKEQGKPRVTIFVRLDTDDILLNEFRLILDPTDGTVVYSTWMGRPMPSLKSPSKLPQLRQAEASRPCRVTFQSDKWDHRTQNRGLLRLLKFMWIKEGTQQVGTYDGG